MSSGNIKLAAQGTNWISPFQNTDSPGVPLQLNAYTGTWTISSAPTTTSGVNSAAPYVVTDGYVGKIICYIVEGNVGTATISVEGSFDNVLWFAVRYLAVVANGTVATGALTAVIAAISQTQNKANVLEITDAYPLMRVRPSTNAGSISAGFYLVPSGTL
jgi:hypothetical protein